MQQFVSGFWRHGVRKRFVYTMVALREFLPYFILYEYVTIYLTDESSSEKLKQNSAPLIHYRLRSVKSVRKE